MQHSGRCTNSRAPIFKWKKRSRMLTSSAMWIRLMTMALVAGCTSVTSQASGSECEMTIDSGGTVRPDPRCARAPNNLVPDSVIPESMDQPNMGSRPMQESPFPGESEIASRESWFARKSIRQTNPMASCPDKSPQINTLVLSLKLNSDVDLLGSDASVFTITGLSGAVVSSSTLPVVTENLCSSSGGQMQPGSDKCFQRLDGYKTWGEAETTCVLWGGHLASIEDEAENTLATQLGSGQYGGVSKWIGLTDSAAEGTWVWSDGSSPGFRKWADGEPNDSGGDEDCAVLLPTGYWNDLHCNARLGGVCAKHVPEQGPLFCMGSASDVGGWDAERNGGTLTLTLCEDAVMKAGETYLLSLNVSNPLLGQPSPGVSISVSGSVNIAAVAMDSFGLDAAGVPGGADPLLILDRCEGCDAGSFWDGLRGCTLCLAGQYSGQINVDSCTACPQGASSLPGSIDARDCYCVAGSLSEEGGACVFCSASETLFGAEGTFSDGSGELEYLEGQTCTWKIVSGTGWKVALTFDELETVQYMDFVTVNECLDAECKSVRFLARLTGSLPHGEGTGMPWRDNQIPRGGLVSTTGVMQVVFSAQIIPDSYRITDKRQGFTAAWHTPDPSFSSRSLYRLDPSLSCTAGQPTPSNPNPTRPPNPPSSEYTGPQEPSESLLLQGAPLSNSTLLLRLSLDSPWGLSGADRSAITITGVSAVADVDVVLPDVLVRNEVVDRCTAGRGFRVGESSKCFAVVERHLQRTWHEAEAACQAWGGHLASVESEEESAMLFKSIRDQGTQRVWIGYSYQEERARFGWADGSTSSFRNWSPYEASQDPWRVVPLTERNCTMMYTWADSQWHLTSCMDRYDGVCSKHLPLSDEDEHLFCSGSSVDVGEWDPTVGNGQLTLRLCANAVMAPDQVYLITLSVTNPADAGASVALGISAGGSFTIEPDNTDVLQEISACGSCWGDSFARWPSSEEECQLGCSSMVAPSHLSFLCQDCPGGMRSPAGATSREECSCMPGFVDHGRWCGLCPEGFYCDGLGAALPCPAHSTSGPGSAQASHCLCLPGFSVSNTGGDRVPPPLPSPPNHDLSRPSAAEAASDAEAASAASSGAACGVCPANSWCSGDGRISMCPGLATAPPGSTSLQACTFCKNNTRLDTVTGNVSDGTLGRHQHPPGTRCSWRIAPQGASKVMLTVSSWWEGANLNPRSVEGRMRLDVKECDDLQCHAPRLLRRFTTTLSNSELSAGGVTVVSETGVMQLVFEPSELAEEGGGSSAPAPVNDGPFLPRPGIMPGGLHSGFLASWVSEPSFAMKAIRQTNPFASTCHGAAAVLHSNMLVLSIVVRSSIPLSGADASAVTITGLAGAVLGSARVPVTAGEVSDECVSNGGVRMEGASKCFQVVSSGVTWDEAEAGCVEWGGHLACIEDDDEYNFVASMLNARYYAASAWIGFSDEEVEGGWQWMHGCTSEYSKWLYGEPNDGAGWGRVPASGGENCAVMSARGMNDIGCGSRQLSVCSKEQPPVERMESMFCAGDAVGAGTWDGGADGNGTLVLNVCEGHEIRGYTSYMIAFSVTNPSRNQPSPPISIAASGSFSIPLTAMDKPGKTRGAMGIAGEEEPLHIVGGGGGQDSAGSKCDILSAVRKEGGGFNAARLEAGDRWPRGDADPMGTVQGHGMGAAAAVGLTIGLLLLGGVLCVAVVAYYRGDTPWHSFLGRSRRPAVRLTEETELEDL